MQPIFITGIGTGIGKTIVSAIVTEALQADYWKPVQAGFDDGTDALLISELILNKDSIIYPEVYKLKLAASPHIAAREENIKIDLDLIADKYRQLATVKRQLIIEGAGGLLVPLNDNEFMLDLIRKLDAKVILVSRNYLGSINHSLLTAMVCKQHNINVPGWIFNDQYMQYEEEIVQWSGYKKLGSVSFNSTIDKNFIRREAEKISASLLAAL
ncbi:dethiobiotin synthase [Panacibacter ginsenosidivorans]|uniref:ATP-dependent dethiobiotin synthetase BioD n=1 Tax=Panacibacter ginsenosidivorans TaxID=1813871 RepID=A0A5B8V907_9BACT|nr:dethiobiotin synthase [Panacibacter ginsenosidivorans]QEC67331.1 dethiobiotin synthase [Panacibacter ginsenosidivorans]